METFLHWLAVGGILSRYFIELEKVFFNNPEIGLLSDFIHHTKYNEANRLFYFLITRGDNCGYWISVKEKYSNYLQHEGIATK